MTYFNHFRANLKLALPIMAAQFGQISVNIVDTFMVGRLGEAPLAAISLGNAVFITLLVFAFGFTIAISTLVAQVDSQKNYKRGAKILKHGFIINLGLVFVMLLLVIPNVNLMYFIKQPTDVVALAIPYLSWMMYSLLPLIIYQTIRQFAEGISQVMMIFYSTLIANLLNIFFNYALIFGNFGFPEMGIKGAAISSFMARFFMLVFISIFIFRNKKARRYLDEFIWKEIDFDTIKRILKLAIPIALQMLFEVATFTTAAFICGYGGKTTDLAAHQIAFTLIATTFMICSGLGVAATIRVGNQFGIKDYVKLRKVGWSVIILCTILVLLFSVLILTFRHQIPVLFSPDSYEVVVLATHLMVFAAIIQIPDGLQVVLMGALRGQQDVFLPTLISFVAFCGISIPLGIYLAIYKDMGAPGMWLTLVIGLSVSAFLLLLRFQYKTRKLILEHEST